MSARAAAPGRRAPVDPRPRVVLGVLAIAVSFAGFGTWAAVAPLASAVIAGGVVTVDSKRKLVQHRDGGTVEAIAVRDGDRVRAGQVLLRLDPTRARSALGIVQARMDAARARRARLEAERDGSAAPRFPEDLLARAAGEPEVAALLTGQRTLHAARRATLRSEREILESRVDQIEQDIAGLDVLQRARRQQVALIDDELVRYETLLADGFVDRPRLLTLQREAARVEGERGEHLSDIARARARIGETELQVVRLERDAREQAVRELRETAAEIADLEERLTAAAHVVDRLAVRAPRDGVVVGLRVHTEGGVVGAGDTLLEIVPATDGLVVEARVRPDDIDSVGVGQPADVRLTAFRWRDAPVLTGEVRYVSADRLVDPRSGEPHYLVRIAVVDEETARLEEKTLVPGMSAEVMIRTGERSALDYLTQPLADSVRRAWREE